MTSGLVTTIQAPDILTRQRIVQKKAKTQGLVLTKSLSSILPIILKVMCVRLNPPFWLFGPNLPSWVDRSRWPLFARW